MPRFTFESTVDQSLETTFAWHSRPGALTRLMPPWLPAARVIQQPPGLTPGNRVTLRVGPVVTESVHTELSEPDGHTAVFADEMRRGPFRSWRHRHEFEATPEGTLVRDVIDWSSPWLPESVARKQLQRMFIYRHHQLAADLAEQARAPRKLTVAISGASGFLGVQLSAFLRTAGHEVRTLVRRAAKNPDEISWDPTQGIIDADRLSSCDAVIHLSGEPLLGRWTKKKMQKILDSRVLSTELIANTLAGMSDGPKVLICASAVGYYGDTSDGAVTENGPQGRGFLADVVDAWEKAADPARNAGLRVVHARVGITLSPQGGLLRLQLPAFLAGLGGPLGDGSQWFSWISHDDAVGMFHHALITDTVEGAFNVVGPNPATGQELARTLGRVLHRPVFMRVPLPAVRLVLGRAAADEMAAASQRALPEKAQATGYPFRHSDLAEALRHMLGRAEA